MWLQCDALQDQQGAGFHQQRDGLKDIPAEQQSITTLQVISVSVILGLFPQTFTGSSFSDVKMFRQEVRGSFHRLFESTQRELRESWTDSGSDWRKELRAELIIFGLGLFEN